MSIEHKERAHSKFSASGSERWLKCSASVALEEQSPPSQDSFWSKEGTLAHEVLECTLKRLPLPASFDVTEEMIAHVEKVARKIRAIHQAFGGTLLVEKKVFASFIHPEMFGTCDAIIASPTMLHIIDFKYGAGHIVSPVENTQLIQYALSAAESYDWDFPQVKNWIMQPRAGEDWHKSWVVEMSELRGYWLPLWHRGVRRVEQNKSKPWPGSHCHYCRAKAICPAKVESRVNEVATMFENSPLTNGAKNGIEKENGTKESKAKSGEEKSRKKKSEKVFEGEAQSFGYENEDKIGWDQTDFY